MRHIALCLLLFTSTACANRHASVSTYGPPPRISEPTPSRVEELELILGDELTAQEAEDLRALRFVEYEPPAGARPPNLHESMEQLLVDEGALLLEEDVDYDIPIVLNDRVEWWVEYFTRRIPRSFERYLARSGAWLPFLQYELAAADLPRDLAYIVLIESGFSTQARSRANAVGPWQFMSSTAREYGLRVDRWVDERRDFERSTRAAIAYLSDLHAMFGSWYLAAAGYNGGQGRIQRSMLRDNTVNFWELTGIRNETRNYVPKLLAATLVAKQPDRYGFDDVEYLEPTRAVSVIVTEATNLDDIAAAAEVPSDVVFGLNPHLVRRRTPPGESYFPVRIPADRLETFATNSVPEGGDPEAGPKLHPVGESETLGGIAEAYEISETALARANGLRPGATLSEIEWLVVPTGGVFEPPKGVRKPSVLTHRVRRGDTLYGLARRYGVTVVAIREMNGLRGSKIIAGSSLLIPLP